MEETECIDPAAFLHFQSHNHAVAALRGVGYVDAGESPEFSADELLNNLNELLKNRGVTFMDMTTAIPETPHAAYKALLIAGFQAAASCRKDENAAFFILRTEANTPSFLFGHHWQATQALGKDVASEQILNSATPAAIVVFKERQICLPTSIFKTNVNIISRIIAHEVTMDKSFFSCALCSESLVLKNKASVLKFAEMCVGPCGRVFKRGCIESYIKENGDWPPLDREKVLRLSA